MTTTQGSGAEHLSKTSFPIRELIDECSHSLDYAPCHELFGECHTDARVFADREHLGQVINTLVSFAAKRSADGKMIIITASKLKGAVKITVTDFGSAIPVEEIPFIFDQDRDHGTGHSLAAAAEMIRNHQGTMGAESIAGRGSRIWFTTPAEDF
ncbi:sensor histidine kinase [Hufsiella ginkgonis]|uniref:histidine kinase n=1 Tax=Hufsiella ginkgonis TaxID=2695274 RepID=A0A7K1XZJ1_9SPHI|nr:HAMP domain-containing sensor histidine kinase [Hufsiella ginkgonis]MXV16435.1 hypothetical protein [Hufsiella ginkgonis]